MRIFIGLFLMSSFGFSNFDAGFDAYHQKNFPLAIEKWSNSCDSGDSRACNVLALMYDNGEFVPKDKSKAKQYYHKACALGDSIGCTFYEKLNTQGH